MEDILQLSSLVEHLFLRCNLSKKSFHLGAYQTK